MVEMSVALMVLYLVGEMDDAMVVLMVVVWVGPLVDGKVVGKVVVMVVTMVLPKDASMDDLMGARWAVWRDDQWVDCSADE